MRRVLGPVVLTVVLALLTGLGAGPAAAVTWALVSSSAQRGISGIAAAGGGWVVVHDVKVAGRTRVSRLADDGTLTPLTWPGTAPNDLEAIDGVPSRTGRYAVVTSAGAGRLIAISGSTLTVEGAFTLPQGRAENEGFALLASGATTIAVWGNRGSASAAGRLYAATFDPTTLAFGAVTSAPVTVPYPTGNVRHISDVEVRSGRLYVASASDGGDRGPFASAVYAVGSVSLSGGRARLAVTTPVELGRYADHKVEGLACTADGGRLGTDDEALGGYVAAGAFCG